MIADDTSGLSRSIDALLDAFGTDPFEASIEGLLKIEMSLVADPPSAQARTIDHLRHWLKIQRAAVSVATCHLGLAETLLLQTRKELAIADPLSFLDHECQCIERSTCSMLLSSVWAVQGKLSSSISLLDELYIELESYPYHGDEIIFEEMNAQREFCVELSGHDLSGRTYIDRRWPRAAESSNYLGHWYPDTPLLGHRYKSFERTYSDRWQTYERVENDDARVKYDALGELLESVQLWSTNYPSATTPRRMLIICALWRATLETRLGKYSELETSMELAQTQLEELVEISDEGIVNYLLIVQNTLPLAIEIAYHEFGDETLRSRYFPLAYGCVITSEALLDEIVENFPISSAVAIVMSLFSDTASSIYEKLSRYPEAVAEMNKSVAIIEELLKRDPSNDRATRLKIAYDAALHSSDADIEREVKNWNWVVE